MADVTELGGTPYLYLDDTSYQIVRRDPQTLVAENKPGMGCVRETITFDRLAKKVTYVRTKIGKESACDAVQDEPVSMYLTGLK